MNLFGFKESTEFDQPADVESPFKPGATCPACNGEGRVRSWSTFFAIFSIVGFGLGFTLLYKLIMGELSGRMNGSIMVILLCAGVFGLIMLVDREECTRCDGMGTLEVEEEEEEADDADAEWAQAPPPE